MEPSERRVTITRHVTGPCERLEIRDPDTGRSLALRPDVLGDGDVPFQSRNEAILGIARAARWRVDAVVLAWDGRELAARITLASDEARIKLDSRPGSALRLALAASCPVSIEDTAWAELERRSGPISMARVADFVAELDAKGTDEMLKEWGQGEVA